MTPDGGATPRGKREPVKLPAWLDAIPLELDPGDQLEVVARFSFRSLVTALARVHADRFMKIGQRVQLLTQINAQMIAVMEKRRLWLAEQIIKGNQRVIAETSRGPEMETAPDAEGTNIANEARRPTARRGRPRKR